MADDDAPSVPLTDSPGMTSPPATNLAPLEAGQILGEFRLLDIIGAGGFSVVWRAERVGTRQVVAVKLPRVPEFISHLRKEAQIRSFIQDAQVVGILGVHLDHDPPFIVMPYVSGVDFALPETAPAPDGIVVAFRRFLEIARVVARLHAAGIVHGDLKPGNIRFNTDRVCMLLDLGLARQQVTVRQNSTLRASVVSVTGEKIAGTLEYMAPEVMSGGKPEPQADVYALGVILHTLLCGRPPAFGISASALNPHLPPGATDFLRQMLHPDPSRRIPSAGELLADVEAFIRTEERCLRRRNGHARRLVFQRRMKTLVRGLKALGFLASIVLLVLFGVPVVRPPESFIGVAILATFPLGFLGMLLGMTTLNAWVMGIPEKSYKKRSGHPWWTFMMQ